MGQVGGPRVISFFERQRHIHLCANDIMSLLQEGIQDRFRLRTQELAKFWDEIICLVPKDEDVHFLAHIVAGKSLRTSQWLKLRLCAVSDIMDEPGSVKKRSCSTLDTKLSVHCLSSHAVLSREYREAWQMPVRTKLCLT